jgi:hypothetical protein
VTSEPGLRRAGGDFSLSSSPSLRLFISLSPLSACFAVVGDSREREQERERKREMRGREGEREIERE